VRPLHFWKRGEEAAGGGVEGGLLRNGGEEGDVERAQISDKSGRGEGDRVVMQGSL